MKNFALLVILAITFSCTKTHSDTAQPFIKVTIEAHSEYQTQIHISNYYSGVFEQNFSKTFLAHPEDSLKVNLFSSIPTTHSIIIKLNDEEVVRRSGNCKQNEYELSYNLSSY